MHAGNCGQSGSHARSRWRNLLINAQPDDTSNLVFPSDSSRVMRLRENERDTGAAAGDPLYIALHGGGSTAASINDNQWKGMVSYYFNGHDRPGLWIAPRGMSDTFNLHTIDISYPMYDLLIESMLVSRNIDPDRVFVLGFSAGGDGVYQIAAHMPDRFAAANMSAGHSNGVSLQNAFNLPMVLQVGDRDTAFNRHIHTVRRYQDLIAHNPDGDYRVSVHDDSGHNGFPDGPGNPSQLKANPVAWAAGNDSSLTTREAGAVNLVHNRRRQLFANSIFRNPATGADLRRGTPGQHILGEQALASPHELFYWVGYDSVRPTTSMALSFRENASALTIELESGTTPADLFFSIAPSMTTPGTPVQLVVNGQSVNLGPRVARLSTMMATIAERSDPSAMAFSRVSLDTVPGDEASDWERAQ